MVAFCHKHNTPESSPPSLFTPSARTSGTNRETIMKALGFASVIALMAGMAQAEGTLALYNWGDYINPDVLAKFTEETGIAVTLDTYSSNEEMLAKIQAGTDYVLAHKGAVSAFTYEVPPMLASGDIAAGHFFVGGNVFFTETPNIKYVIPAEGGAMYQENICVLASAPNKDNAKKFLEFYLRPEIAALNVAQQYNGTPNTPANALTPDAIKSNPNINVASDTMARLQIFEDIGAALKLYDRAWNTIRTAQ